MFTRGRPVPSARTVRLLYQLGYICSGTAAGLATLCLEEQRRRIQILQRIADNAKVIRQHPRYRGNAALAVETGDDGGLVAIEGGWTPERLGRRRRRREEESIAVNDGAVGAPSLPSVVEREYSQLFGQGQDSLAKSDGLPRFHQTRRTIDQGRQEKYEAVPDVSATEESLLSARMPTTTSPYAKSLREMRDPTALIEPNSITYRTLRKVRYMQSTISHSIFGDELEPSAASLNATEVVSQSRPKTRSGATAGWHGEASRELKPVHSLEEPSLTGISPDDLSHDIGLFLKAGATEHAQSNAVISTKFFRWALAIGSLEDIRAMFQWKLANDLFMNRDARFLYRSGRTLGDRHNHQELFDFFTTMFESNDFSHLNTHVRLKLALTVLGSSFKWDSDVKPSSLQHTILGEFLCGAEDDVVTEILGNVCKDFVSKGDASVVAELFVLVANSRKHQVPFDALADELFQAMIVGGNITHCATLLRWKRAHVKHEAMMPLLNSFVQACGDQKAYRLLVNLLGQPFSGLKIRRSKLVEHLVPSNRAVLSLAFSVETGMHQAFEKFYRSLPLSMRSSVDDSAIAGLRVSWSSTRNFKRVGGRISVLLNNFQESGNEKAIRELDETALEIYINAGKMDLAHKTVKRMHKDSGVSNLAMCQTGLMFAKQGSWDSLTRLLEIMRESPSFVFDTGSTRIFNAIIHVHCQRHSAEESWNFVTACIRELKFIPNRSSLDILLQHFVSTERFDLIPEWISFLDASGYSMELDAHTVADLLRRYYMSRRPSHMFVMWLCRKLTLLSPSFASQQLNQLVQQAIGYDLRHLSGQYASWQQVQAEIRLERVMKSTCLIPSPGFVWNEQLYFPDSGEDRDVAQQIAAPEPHIRRIFDRSDGEDVTEGSKATSDTSLDFVTDFEALRSSEDENDTPHHLDKYDFSRTDQKNLEGLMWLHLSRGQYQQALDLYHKKLDAAGIPASPVVLEIAVEASLRLHKGDRSNADEIMTKARDAGMNTTCATGPLIIHELKQLHPESNIDVGYLRKAVMDYYESNEDNGWRVMHYLGVSAAHLLISSRYPHHGLEILSFMYTSKWGQERPLDIVGMTVFLKGYIKTQSLDGIRWVVQTVLDRDLRITRPFLKQLRFLKKGGFKFMDKHPPEIHPLLESWVEVCEARRKEQIAETHKLGWHLVKQIAKCSKATADIDIDAPNYLEDRTSAERDADTEDSADSDFIDESYFSDEALSGPEKADRFAEIRRRIIEDWNAEKRFRQRMKRATLAQGTWDKYRPFVLPETRGEDHLGPKNLEIEDQVTAPWMMDDSHSFADDRSQQIGDQRHVTTEPGNSDEDGMGEGLAVFKPFSPRAMDGLHNFASESRDKTFNQRDVTVEQGGSEKDGKEELVSAFRFRPFS